MNRREVLMALAAGGVLTAEGLWMPGRKLISIANYHAELYSPEMKLIARPQINGRDFNYLCDLEKRVIRYTRAFGRLHDLSEEWKGNILLNTRDTLTVTFTEEGT